MNIDWNVKEYLKDFAFVPKYGEAVLDMIDAAPGTLAVDLGCGNFALNLYFCAGFYIFVT